MLKKIISLLLVFSFIFCFASCKADDNFEKNTSSTESKSENTSSTEPQSDNTGLTEPISENTSKDNSPTKNTADVTASTASETSTQVPTVKVTIPEGYTLVRISWLLEEKGFCTSDEFLEAAQTYTKWLDLTQYPFLNSLKSAENVCFYLEGYIFPLTYEIPKNANARDIIKMFLNGTKQKLNSAFMSRVQQSGFSVHEILTLASLIEKEAVLPEQRAMISSVLHNRLNKGMQFQCDPTVKYCTGVIQLIYPEKIDHFKYYYNTYRCKGLMAGPICNPGWASIEAALSPAKTNYLYFIIGTVPPYEAKYSETYAEHQKYWEENKDRLTGGNS